MSCIWTSLATRTPDRAYFDHLPCSPQPAAPLSGHYSGRATPSLRDAPTTAYYNINRRGSTYRGRNTVSTKPATSDLGLKRSGRPITPAHQHLRGNYVKNRYTLRLSRRIPKFEARSSPMTYNGYRRWLPLIGAICTRRVLDPEFPP